MKKKTPRPKPPTRKPLTLAQIAERGRKLQAAADRWFSRLLRATGELRKIRDALARLRKSAGSRTRDPPAVL